MMAMDRKFQSALPGGNIRNIQIIKSNGRSRKRNNSCLSFHFTHWFCARIDIGKKICQKSVIFKGKIYYCHSLCEYGSSKPVYVLLLQLVSRSLWVIFWWNLVESVIKFSFCLCENVQNGSRHTSCIYKILTYA